MPSPGRSGCATGDCRTCLLPAETHLGIFHPRDTEIRNCTCWRDSAGQGLELLLDQRRSTRMPACMQRLTQLFEVHLHSVQRCHTAPNAGGRESLSVEQREM